MLNQKLKSFKFRGHDQINKPQLVQLGQDSKKIGGNAHENWSLLRTLPLLVGLQIPENNPVGDIILHLKDIVEIVFSPILSESAIAFIDTLIQEPKLLLVQCFPDFKLKQKHHFVEH
jgi:hypothetical protein